MKLKPVLILSLGRVDDKSIHLDGNTADTNFSTDTVKNMGRFRGYSNSSSMSRRSVVLVESDSDSILSNSDDDNDILSIKSAISRDNDSFHTARDSDDEYDFDQSEITEDEYSVQSEITDLLSSEGLLNPLFSCLYDFSNLSFYYNYKKMSNLLISMAHILFLKHLRRTCLQSSLLLFRIVITLDGTRLIAPIVASPIHLFLLPDHRLCLKRYNKKCIR